MNHDTDPTGYTLARKTLENRAVAATYVMSRAAMERVPDAEALMRDQLRYQLKSYVLSDHITDDTYRASTTFEYPRSTWHMFKSRHAESWWLRWLVRRRPIQMATERRTVAVKVERYLGYPDATIRTPDLGPAFIYETARQI